MQVNLRNHQPGYALVDATLFVKRTSDEEPSRKEEREKSQSVSLVPEHHWCGDKNDSAINPTLT